MRKANKNIAPAIDSISLYGGVENTRYFYHGDHLGSSSWITDKDGNALQYISYLPYGQLFMNLKTTSYDASYKFIGKERDSETGFVITDHRSYDPNLGMFLSVDPLAHLRFWITPYNYGQNSPINRSDPSGLLDGEFRKWNGKLIGRDPNEDNNVFIVSDEASILIIEANDRIGGTTLPSSVKVDVSTNKDVLKDIIDVDARTESNGNFREEQTIINTDGSRFKSQGDDVRTLPWKVEPQVITEYEGNIGVNIHSHLSYLKHNPDDYNNIRYWDATDPSEFDKSIKGNLNVITGPLGKTIWKPDNSINSGHWQVPSTGAVFYDSQWKIIKSTDIKSIKKMLR